MKEKVNLNALSIILVRPKFHENIGSVARAMKNMGLTRLMIVNGCSPLHPNAYKLASGAEDILERAEEFFAFREAISEMGCVVGTTSRGGKERYPLLTPKTLAKKLIPLSIKNAIGLAFGSEKEGLTMRNYPFVIFMSEFQPRSPLPPSILRKLSWWFATNYFKP